MSITYTTLIQLLPSQTGEALSAQLYDTAGVTVGSPISAGFVEMEVGDYVWSYTFTQSFNGFVSFFISAEYQATSAINVVVEDIADEIIDAVEAAIDALESTLTVSTVTVLSPFEAGTSNFTITRGDDYHDALDNAITWRSNGWPELPLTEGAVRLAAIDKYDVYGLMNEPLTVSSDSDGYQILTLQLTNAKTHELTLGENAYEYDIQAIIDSKKITLANGFITVIKDVEDFDEGS